MASVPRDYVPGRDFKSLRGEALLNDLKGGNTDTGLSESDADARYQPLALQHLVSSADYQMQATDGRVIVDSPSARVVWLPPARAGAGHRYTIASIGSGITTLDTLDSDTVLDNGTTVTTYSLTQGQSVEVIGTTRADGSWVYVRV